MQSYQLKTLLGNITFKNDRIIHSTDFSNEMKNTAYKVSFFFLMGFLKVIRQLKWNS